MRGGRAGATSNLVMRWNPHSPIALELGGWIRMGGATRNLVMRWNPIARGSGTQVRFSGGAFHGSMVPAMGLILETKLPNRWPS